MDWLRLWHEMPNDPKWRTIARVSGQPISVVLSVYLHILTNASANATERGRTQSFSSEDVASALDVETGDVEAIMAAMQGRVMDGESVTGWEKRQPIREDGAAERAKAWRERKKEENRTQPNATERRPNADRTQPNENERLDTDTDTDKEARALVQRAARFDEFWSIYPLKKGKPAALAKWKSRNLDAIADRIMADVKARIAGDRQWLEGFIPHGSTYVSKSGWEDAIEPPKLRAVAGSDYVALPGEY